MTKKTKLEYYIIWKSWRPFLSYAEQAIVYDIIDNIIVENDESTFVSQQTIADNLGKKRENISRVISSLISKKIVYRSTIKTKKWNKNCYKLNWKWAPAKVENIDFGQKGSDKTVVSNRHVSSVKSSQVVVSNRHTNNLLYNLNNNKTLCENEVFHEKKKTKKTLDEDAEKLFCFDAITLFNQTFKKNIRTIQHKAALRKARAVYSDQELLYAIENYNLEHSNSFNEMNFKKYLNFRNIFKFEVIDRILEEKNRIKAKIAAKREGTDKIWVAGKGWQARVE